MILAALLCAFMARAAAQTYNMNNTPVTACSGTFYDSGGSAGNYGNDQNFTKTFCASSAGQVLSFNFTAFRTNDAGDVLYVYDGPDASSPLICALTGNLGGFGTINSSGQCLTFVFVSNSVGVRLGWAATISCTTMAPCNYMLTVIDAGCNGTGSSLWNVYFNGAPAGSVWPDPWCRRNILMTGLTAGTSIIVNYVYDGDPAIDTQNAFQIMDGYGNVVAAGYMPNGGSAYSTSVASLDANCTEPSGTSLGEDCGWTYTLCDDESFSGNSSGQGQVYELDLSNTGCLFGEHQSSWYYFQSATAGTLEVSITPSNGTDDYDFAIWDASACPPGSAPIRCSWAATAGQTGVGNGAGDLSESFDGDGWVAPIIAAAGQQFVMLVDNWSSSSSSYTVDWTLSGGATLDCALMPVELMYIEATCENDEIRLRWATASETNCEKFVVERSVDLRKWKTVSALPGAGTINYVSIYEMTDASVPDGTYYYRLSQVDFDGAVTRYGPVSTECGFPAKSISVMPNPFADELLVHADGLGQCEMSVRVYNSVGGELMSFSRLVDSDSYTTGIATSHFPDGPYLIAVSCGGLVKTFKNVKHNE
jgi:hypothetical protein